MRLWPLLGACALAGCGAAEEAVIDGSSDEAFVASAAAARSELSLEERLIFDKAIQTVGSRRHGADDVDALRRTTFDGMTGAQVVADARARGLGD
ncbi:hypothetical protein [Sphingomicrobium lutaoense]|uniref:Lipoprotein n=1 Tax=Sphingomicrobium lutaoense TaxID=515949 RepID=A0A839YYY1_9SPHN|nr:hypothetical protein [Sphingomicrobium lutaoense]MBB3764196.1 hypothetical protein [Sphingomicrobium lutaoense]